MKKAISGEEKSFHNTGLRYSVGFSNALPTANRNDHPWRCQDERFTG